MLKSMSGADTTLVRVGIGCFVWRDNKFLMIKRLGAHGAGTWSVPGGHLEFGESWEDCAAREVKEETGIEITNQRLLATTNDFFPIENKHYVTIWIESDWLSGDEKIMEPDKCTELAWRDFADLPKDLFLPWQNLKSIRPDLFASTP